MVNAKQDQSVPSAAELLKEVEDILTSNASQPLAAFDSKYRKVKLLGYGAFGDVYLIRQGN